MDTTSVEMYIVYSGVAAEKAQAKNREYGHCHQHEHPEDMSRKKPKCGIVAAGGCLLSLYHSPPPVVFICYRLTPYTPPLLGAFTAK